MNGKDVSLDATVTLTDLVAQLGYTEGPVAIEKNGEIVPRKEHAQTRVSPGDVLEIVHFVGGG